MSEKVGGDPDAAAKASAGASSNKGELHFLGAKIGPIVESALNMGQRIMLPDTAFADEKQRNFPHHHKTGEIDMTHLEAERLHAQQVGANEAFVHLDNHMKALKAGEYAEMKEGIPTDGRWAPQGFVVRGNKAVPQSEESWNAYNIANASFVKIGAMIAGIEEDMMGITRVAKESHDLMTHTSGLVQSGYVSRDEFEQCKRAMKEDQSKALEGYVKSESIPTFLQESVVRDDLGAIEGAARFVRAVKGLPETMKRPQLAFNLGASAQMMVAYKRGSRDTIEAVLKELQKEMSES